MEETTITAAASVQPKKAVYYAVRIGRNPGIYTSVRDCQDQVTGFSCARSKRFDSKEEAEEYMLKVERLLPPLPTDDSGNPITPIRRSERNRESFYAVRIGRIPGIYSDSDQFQLQIKGHKNAEGGRFGTIEEALTFMRFGRNVPESLQANDQTKKKQVFYAVRVGRQPGIYNSSEVMKKQVVGFTNAKCKRFSTLEDAEKFMNAPIVSPQTSQKQLLVASQPANVSPQTSSAFHFPFNSNQQKANIQLLSNSFPSQQTPLYRTLTHNFRNASLKSNSLVNHQKSSFVPFFEDFGPNKAKEVNGDVNKKRKSEEDQDVETNKKRIRSEETSEKDQMQILNEAVQSISSIEWNDFERLPSFDDIDEEVKGECVGGISVNLPKMI